MKLQLLALLSFLWTPASITLRTLLRKSQDRPVLTPPQRRLVTAIRVGSIASLAMRMLDLFLRAI